MCVRFVILREYAQSERVVQLALDAAAQARLAVGQLRNAAPLVLPAPRRAGARRVAADHAPSSESVSPAGIRPLRWLHPRGRDRARGTFGCGRTGPSAASAPVA